MKNILICTFSIQFQDWLPYPAGCLISYCKQDKKILKKFNFLEPEFLQRNESSKKFQEKLEKTDILGLTCYIWNQEINDRIAKRFKEINPNGIVVYGGPQIPENNKDSQEFCIERPYSDLHFVGPAEENFKQFLLNIDKPFNTHEGTVGIGWNNVNVDRKLYKVEWTPTPYTDGTLTHLFEMDGDNVVIPMETNRGCPYSCAFCDWGSVIRSKITKFDKDEIKKVIEYAFKGNISRIEFIDANYGIFKEDLEYIRELVVKKYEYNKDMKVTFCGLAKNGSRFLPEIMSTIQKEFEENNNTMKLSIQTHTEEALKVAERSNIRNEKMIEIYNEVKKQGYEINSELIIGMPGETSETWLDVLQKDIDNGCYFNRAYPLTVMPNTTYYSQEFRKKYNANLIKIYAPKDLLDLKLTDYHKNRLNAKNYKTKNNKNNKLEWRSITMFNRCYSYSTEDLEQMYMYWWWFGTLFNTGFARKYMLNSKKHIREQAYDFFDNIDNMPLFKSFLLDHQYAFRKNLTTNSDKVWLTDLLSVQYIIKSHMRLREAVDIYDNLDIAANEIRLVYKNFTIDHIDIFETKKKYFKLYSSDGSMEKKHANNPISESPISIPA
tara:strand:+ start:17922 stop:19739 length:1818 start_codon:yes stop_codon:yes gene_type:complete